VSRSNIVGLEKICASTQESKSSRKKREDQEENDKNVNLQIELKGGATIEFVVRV